MIQIISQIFDNDAFKILTVMSLSRGSRFMRKELKDRTRMNNVTLDNSLQILINAKIIRKDDKYLFLNLENNYAKQISEIAFQQYKELKEIPLDAYFAILDMVSFLSRFKHVDAYLFGSYSKLVFRETSDIDLAIISDTIGENKKEIRNATQKTEKKYGKIIEIQYFGTDFYRNKKDPIVEEILRNGVKLI